MRDSQYIKHITSEVDGISGKHILVDGAPRDLVTFIYECRQRYDVSTLEKEYDLLHDIKEFMGCFEGRKPVSIQPDQLELFHHVWRFTEGYRPIFDEGLCARTVCRENGKITSS
jgi:hypothetical protein